MKKQTPTKERVKRIYQYHVTTLLRVDNRYADMQRERDQEEIKVWTKT